MEGQWFRRLYRRLLEIASLRRRKHEQFCDVAIVATFLWAVLHDRPQGWACDPENWSIPPPFGELPSESRLSRRLRTRSVQQLMDHLSDYVWGRFKRRMVKCIDGKPLSVSFSSKDKTATVGFATGRTAKGYRLHAIVDTGGVLVAWAVSPMHQGEATVARRLIRKLTDVGYVLADNNYDRNGLYDWAGGYGHQLVAPPKPSCKALGKIRHSPYRLHGLDLLTRPFGQNLLTIRHCTMERFFGNLGCAAGGLGPLPGFVRTIRRVRRWVHAKLILHAIRIQKNKELQQ
jgi:hypothetical protein